MTLRPRLLTWITTHLLLIQIPYMYVEKPNGSKKTLRYICCTVPFCEVIGREEGRKDLVLGHCSLPEQPLIESLYMLESAKFNYTIREVNPHSFHVSLWNSCRLYCSCTSSLGPYFFVCHCDSFSLKRHHKGHHLCLRIANGIELSVIICLSANYPKC